MTDALKVSVSCSRYLNSLADIESFVGLVMNSVVTTDYAAYAFRELPDRIRSGSNDPPKYRSPSELLEGAPGPATLELRRLFVVMEQMVIPRVVDGYVSYIAALITEALKIEPNLLRSREMVDYETVLNYSNIDELRLALIEKKVTDLSFAGFRELERWFDSRMNLTLVADPTSRSTVIELIETRNIIVHNECRVSQRYLDRVPNSPYHVGDKREWDSKYMFESISFFEQSVIALDGLVASKMSIPTIVLVDRVTGHVH